MYIFHLNMSVCAVGYKPLLNGSSLFSRISLASVPSSMRSSFVMTPMVRRPAHIYEEQHVSGYALS